MFVLWHTFAHEVPRIEGVVLGRCMWVLGLEMIWSLDF